MWKCGQWGTNVEIPGFATMLNTDVYVYCNYGGRSCWTNLSPISSTAESNVYILYRNGHCELVLTLQMLY